MSFNRLAPHYQWLEVVLAGRVLQRARIAHLSVLTRGGHVLLAGEGPGRLLAALRVLRPDLQVTVLDASSAMLRAAAHSAARQPGGCADVDFLQADLRTWDPPEGRFDAIVTPCVLDCFGTGTLPQVVHRLARAARPIADWLHVDFAIPRRGWRRARARAIHALMYATFRVVAQIEAWEVTPPDPWLGAAGFRRLAEAEFSQGLICSEHWRRG